MRKCDSFTELGGDLRKARRGEGEAAAKGVWRLPRKKRRGAHQSMKGRKERLLPQKDRQFEKF